MRKYDNNSIEKSQNKTSIIENNGIKIILKPSPREERPGYLDTEELNIMKNNWAGQLEDEVPVSMLVIPIWKK